MPTRKFLLGLAVLATQRTMPAAASDGLRAPSNNVVCIFDDSFLPSAMRCDVRNLRPTKLRRPKDCHLGWGDAFAIGENGERGERICHGDTIMHEDVMVLPYGTVWQRGVFTCRSEITGLTCFNAEGHGFSISKISQRLF